MIKLLFYPVKLASELTMKLIPYSILLLLLNAFFCLSYASSQQVRWTPLLDTELSHWQGYLSYRHQEGYNGNIPKDENGNELAAIGLLDDPQQYGVFTTLATPSKQESSPVLRVSGEIYGGLTTKQSYRNYHFTLKFKWGTEVFNPRKKLLKDSGILYHAIGEHGQEYWRSWMVSQEFQIMQGHLGDYWSQGNSAIDIRAFLPEYVMNAVADETQPFRTVGAKQSINGFVLRKENFEKPAGAWNKLELICFEGKSLHIVNGEVVMVLQHSRTVDKNGVATPLLAGKIQLQSEAAELYYKDIFIRQLTELPQQYQQLFN